MGLSEAMIAIREAWYTISPDGFPEYKLTSDGVYINREQMEEYASATSTEYDVITDNPDMYISEDKEALAYA